MMQKLTDNRTAIKALQRVGYECVCPLGHTLRNGYLMKCPDGKTRDIKIHKSGTRSGSGGRHWFGISHEDLPIVQLVVFYAEAEDYILVVPRQFLLEILNSNQKRAKLIQHQWHVNVYFDRDGQAELVPVGMKPYPLDEFRERLPR